MSWLLAVALFGLHAGIQRDDGAMHVRSTDAAMLEVFRDGSRRSKTFKSLVDALNQTSTIVYVERGVCGFGHYAACLPHAVTLAGGIRYLRVLVDTSRTADVTALIAHELQHALEIARAPTIRTPDDITALFRRIGRSPSCPRGVPDCYETSEARAIGEAVRKELRRAHARIPSRSALPYRSPCSI
jgi:hypothetical protein